MTYTGLKLRIVSSTPPRRPTGHTTTPSSLYYTMMNKALLYAILVTQAHAGIGLSARMALDEDLIARVNAANAGWTAGASPRFAGLTLAEARNMLNTLDLDAPRLSADLPRANVTAVDATAVPLDFDSRDEWPGCVQPIRDQVRRRDESVAFEPSVRSNPADRNVTFRIRDGRRTSRSFEPAPTVVTAVDRCDSCNSALGVFLCTTDHQYAQRMREIWGAAHES